MAHPLSMERRDPLTDDQAAFLRRMRDEWMARAESMPLGPARRELLEVVGDMDGTLALFTPEPSPLHTSAVAALEAWDALHHTTRAITGPDFVEAMERLRMEVYG